MFKKIKTAPGLQSVILFQKKLKQTYFVGDPEYLLNKTGRIFNPYFLNFLRYIIKIVLTLLDINSMIYLSKVGNQLPRTKVMKNVRKQLQERFGKGQYRITKTGEVHFRNYTQNEGGYYFWAFFAWTVDEALSQI
ncbi:hypothetical protein [Leptospira noguchii]|nr:hypothetical protein [Leptospira noguchii]